MRIENAASAPSATGSTLPSRTSARLDCASTIVRDVNRTGCRYPDVPAGARPAALNCSAT